MAAIPQDAVCLGCGYSLRGLEHSVCPECGRPFDPAKRHTFGPQSAGMSRHDKTLALAVVYAAGLVVGLMGLLLANWIAWLLVPVLAALLLIMIAPVAPSDVCDRCGREFRRGIPEKCPGCGADLGGERKRYSL